MEPEKRRQRSAAAWLARLSGIVIILPASMAAGWIMGYFVVDHYLKSYPWGSVGFTLLGAGAGFREIYRMLTSGDEPTDDPHDNKH